MDREMLKAMFGLQEITRFHMVQCKQPQTVADHSFRVGVIASYLADQVGACPMTALYWGIVHDADEFVTGDIPTHVKIALHRKDVKLSDLSSLPQVPAQYKWIVKSADYMEALLWLGKNYQSKRSIDVYGYISNSWAAWVAALPAQDGIAVKKVYETLTKLDKDQVDYNLKWPEELTAHVGE